MPRFLSLLALFSLGCQDYELSTEKELEEVPAEDSELPDVPEPDIEVEPSTLAFGALPEDCASEPQEFVIRNVGQATLEVTNIDLSGDGSSVFELVAGPITLEPGEEESFEVVFSPNALESFEVPVTITSNDPDEAESEVELRGEGAENAIYEQVYQQPEAGQVDVLFVVDNSGSMSEEVDRLKEGFDSFIASFVDMDLDWQIGITTTDMDDPAQQGHLIGSPSIITPESGDAIAQFNANASAVFTQASASGDERGLDAAYAALTDPLISGDNAGLVRPDANLSVIVISDENDFSDISENAFSNWLNAYKGDEDLSSLSAIVGKKAVGFDLGGCMEIIDIFTGESISAEAAPIYIDAAAATGGMFVDICELDFDEVLTYLSYNAAGLMYSFPLDHEPLNIGQIDVFVEGNEVPYNGINGWTYDPDSQSVILHGSYAATSGETVEIRYPYEADCD